jgi:hypothetical protein
MPNERKELCQGWLRVSLPIPVLGNRGKPTLTPFCLSLPKLLAGKGNCRSFFFSCTGRSGRPNLYESRPGNAWVGMFENQHPIMLQVILLLCGSVLAQTPDKPAAVTYSQVNTALGLSLWDGDNLWDDQAAAVAKRLKWPQESKTSYDSSYRLYTQPFDQVLDEHAYSLSLDGDAQGNITDVSIIFANVGDVKDLVQDPQARTGQVSNADQGRLVAAVRDAIEKESVEITTQLTALLGRYTFATYGTDPKSAESVQRWDWNGHAILLATGKEKYLTLRIVPSEVADRKYVKPANWEVLRKQLAQRVVHRDNGDVVIQDIPMVDQGPKGYCVPATWVRDLRYMGIPADLYQMAMLGFTSVGGNTSFAQMAGGVNNLIHTYGYRLVSVSGSMQTQTFADKIDQGLPVMWGMFVVDKLNSDLSLRSSKRKAITTVAGWDAYTKSLGTVRLNVASLKIDQNNGHLCMIIGYNKKTNELAITDSWGPNYAERWITVEEAQAISQGILSQVSW